MFVCFKLLLLLLDRSVSYCRNVNIFIESRSRRLPGLRVMVNHWILIVLSSNRKCRGWTYKLFAFICSRACFFFKLFFPLKTGILAKKRSEKYLSFLYFLLILYQVHHWSSLCTSSWFQINTQDSWLSLNLSIHHHCKILRAIRVSTNHIYGFYVGKLFVVFFDHVSRNR